MMGRPSRDEISLRNALLVAERSTCMRRHVGCVLTNAAGHVLSTGYNGVACGQPHCNHKDGDSYPYACKGARLPSGQGLDLCEAIHAEQNALLQCRDVYTIETAYMTASPCVTCTKLLLNTSTKRIVFLEAYPQQEAKELWMRGGLEWVHYEEIGHEAEM